MSQTIHDSCGRFNDIPAMEEVRAMIDVGRTLSPELAGLIREAIGTSANEIEAGVHFNLNHFLEDLGKELAHLICPPAADQPKLSYR